MLTELVAFPQTEFMLRRGDSGVGGSSSMTNPESQYAEYIYFCMKSPKL